MLQALPQSKQTLPKSLQTLQTPRPLSTLAIVLTALAVATGVVLVAVPWQQTVSGKGKVIVFSPRDRPQNLEAQISARLDRWLVSEGDSVKAGQIIAYLTDIDSKFLDPSQLKSLQTQRAALLRKREATAERVNALSNQISDLGKSQKFAIPAAQQKAQQATDRATVAQQTVIAAQQTLKTSQLNYARLKELYSKGLRSRRDFELAELEYVRSRTELERAQASQAAAARDVTVGDFDSSRVATDTSASLNGIRASVATAREAVATIDSDLSKLDIDIANLKARKDQQIVRAPRAGRVVRLLAIGAGSTVKAGDVLAVLAPDTQDRAVELYVTDNDVPLVDVGRPVRLQFAGWPAVQFAGWPSVAVGTFGGRVSVVDAIDDGTSRYRVIIVPDVKQRDGKDEPWPSTKYLRPGAEANGWIQLNTVSLGFELWRQFNGFPATVQKDPVPRKGGK
ncbi:MAG: biotin/lipoyl-binding protein [Anaerolineae bacterium]|nr:biotin/lipoyl-binding protein [Gloeobacterales cyanobacterium ES-bin-313]